MSDSYYLFGRKPLQYAVIDPVHCTGCGWCAMFCPVGCMFQRTDGFYGLNVDKCIGCRSCRVNCFYDAVTMVGRGGKSNGNKSRGKSEKRLSKMGQKGGCRQEKGNTKPSPAPENF